METDQQPDEQLVAEVQAGDVAAFEELVRRTARLVYTATLVTDRPKKGDHRAHIGLYTAQRTRVYSLTLQKGARDRPGEERLVSDLLLRTCAEGCGLEPEGSLSLLPEEQVTIEELGQSGIDRNANRART